MRDESSNSTTISFPSTYFNNIIFCAVYVCTEPRRLAKGGKYEAERKTASWPDPASFRGVYMGLSR